MNNRIIIEGFTAACHRSKVCSVTSRWTRWTARRWRLTSCCRLWTVRTAAAALWPPPRRTERRPPSAMTWRLWSPAMTPLTRPRRPEVRDAAAWGGAYIRRQYPATAAPIGDSCSYPNPSYFDQTVQYLDSRYLVSVGAESWTVSFLGYYISPAVARARYNISDYVHGSAEFVRSLPVPICKVVYCMYAFVCISAEFGRSLPIPIQLYMVCLTLFVYRQSLVGRRWPVRRRRRPSRRGRSGAPAPSSSSGAPVTAPPGGSSTSRHRSRSSRCRWLSHREKPPPPGGSSTSRHRSRSSR